MEPQALLALYDQDQRITVEWPGQRREVVDPVIRLIDPQRQHSFVLYSKLSADNADAVIAREKAYFRALGHSFEWKLFAHDTPPDLKDRLAAAGLEIVEPAEAIMVLDLDTVPDLLAGPPLAAVRRVTTREQVYAMLRVQAVVWDHEYDWLAEELSETLAEHPDQLSIYAAYVDDQPVSAGWIRFLPGRQFASLWGGSTLPDYRGRGFYSALLAVRAQEARQRGLRFLTVDASPMSRPILEKHGFTVITWAWECFQPKPDEEAG